jgi:DNA-binding MarR family transcriptional regulator
VSRRNLLLELAVTNAFVSRLFDQTLTEAGIKPTHVGVLLLIRESEPVTPSELERISGFAATTLRDRVKQLLREGLVERRPDANDRRSYELLTTVDGRALIRRARPVLRRALEKQRGHS